MFVHGQRTLQLRTLATGQNFITFRTPDDLWLKDVIVTLMYSRISVKHCIGEYALLMGNRVLTIYHEL